MNNGNRLRIGIDSHAAEQDGTGNCTYFRNLILRISELDTENHYILFVTNQAHPFYRSLKDRPNFEIIQILKKPAWLRVFVALCIATYRKKLDVLHVQYFAPFVHRGILVNTIHDLSSYHFPQYFSLFERVLFKTILPLSSRKSARVLTASEVSKQDLVQLMNIPEERVTVSLYGVEERFSTPLSRENIDAVRKRFDLHGKYVLYVGRIDPRKNLIRVVQAYSRFRSLHGMDHKLAIIGKVYLEQQALAETLKQSQYRNDIEFCGYVPDEDLPAIYKGAEAFIYTSEYEGFGLPPLEAMASGTPVVASDIPIFREILSDAAILVNPRDIDEIANAIHTAVSDQMLRQTLIQKGKDQVQRYRWSNTARITVQAYEEVVRQFS